jgi:ribosome-associated protein
MRKKKDAEPLKLEERIIESIREKKGKNIINIDLTKLNNSICEFFIISHSESNTQVRAIAQNIEEKVKKHLKQNAFHTEGYENAQWILLDYNSVVVHIFQETTRNYYKLEELWADGLLIVYPEEE